MSVSGARRSRELTQKYARAVYGRAEKEDKAVKARGIRFCPRCGSYIPVGGKCRNCGYEPEDSSSANQ